MPTYQYRCTECGHDLEAVQKFSDAALTECPACGGPLRKVFNAVGVVFKGSGFYRTDSRKDAGKGPSTSSSGAKSDTSAGGESGTKKESASTTSSGTGSSGAGSSGSSVKQPAASGSSTAS